MKKNILFPVLGAFVITAIAGSLSISKEVRAGDKLPSVSCSPTTLYVNDTVPKKKMKNKSGSGMGKILQGAGTTARIPCPVEERMTGRACPAVETVPILQKCLCKH